MEDIFYEIWFSGNKVCQCYQYEDAICVFEALTAKYRHVIMYNSRGVTVKEYINK